MVWNVDFGKNNNNCRQRAKLLSFAFLAFERFRKKHEF